jgi:hypothetical protein
MGIQGDYVNRLDLFRSGIPFEGEIDVDWFVTIPNQQTAETRLRFLRTSRNIEELISRGYGGEALDRMWKAVYRSCLVYGVPIPRAQHGHARELGVVITDED